MAKRDEEDRRAYGDLELVRILWHRRIAAGFGGSLKLLLRPLTCPYADLLEDAACRRRVFDIGCGSGTFLLLVSELTGPDAVGGAEVSERLVDNARRLLSGFSGPTDLFAFDGVTLPERVSRYDVFFLIDVLHHIPATKQRPFLEMIFRVTPSGSIFVLKDMAAESPLVLVNRLHDLLFSGEVGTERRTEEVTEMLEEIGFLVERVTNTRKWVYAHFTIVARHP